MDGENRSSTPKKPRFTPKAPPRRKPKPVTPKANADDGNSASAQEMLRRFNEAHRRPLPPKLEQEGSSQMNLISSTHSPSPAQSEDKNVLSLPSAGATSSTKVTKLKKDYVEPWDYHHSDYPTTLPWRRPYSGDPDVLNAEEFGGGDPLQLDYEEPALDSASELGLLQGNENPELFLVQLPPVLPVPKQGRILKGKAIAVSEPIGSSERGRANVHPSVKGKEIASMSVAKRGRGAGGKEEEKHQFHNLDEFPGGYLGKMIVYKSGKIQLKIGEILHDVSSGSHAAFAQEAVAINTEEKICCALGDVGKRIVVAPDVDFMLKLED